MNKSLLYKDMEVFYTVSGSIDKPAIVFLHPAFGDHTMFTHQIAYFEKNYYVITVDMVAHGKSQPRKEKVTMGVCRISLRAYSMQLVLKKRTWWGYRWGPLWPKPWPLRFLSVFCPSPSSADIRYTRTTSTYEKNSAKRYLNGSFIC